MVFIEFYVDDGELTKKAASSARMTKPEMTDDPARRKQWTTGRTASLPHTTGLPGFHPWTVYLSCRNHPIQATAKARTPPTMDWLFFV